MSALALQESTLPFPAQQYALIFLDQDGQLVIDVSPSLVGYETDIFTPEVTTQFMAFASSYDETQAYLRMSISQTVVSEPPSWSRTSDQVQAPECYWNVRQAPWWAQPAQESPFGLISCNWKSDTRYKRRKTQKNEFQPPPKGTLPCAPSQQRILQIDKSETLKLFYQQAFEKIKQTCCRTIAKAYVKLLEPRKQVNFPYNGRKIVNGKRKTLDPESTKPPWWPEEIEHREPDHLLKNDRLALLLHILCGLKESHGVTVAKLRDCDIEICRKIENDNSRLNTMNILGEIYSVREMEERYLGGDIDFNSTVKITREGKVKTMVETLSYADDSSESNELPVLSFDFEVV